MVLRTSPVAIRLQYWLRPLLLLVLGKCYTEPLIESASSFCALSGSFAYWICINVFIYPLLDLPMPSIIFTNIVCFFMLYCAAESRQSLEKTQRGKLVRSTYQEDRKRVPSRKVLLVGHG